MKYIVTGANGQLGFDVVRALSEQGYQEILALDHTQWDITDAKQTEKIILDYHPDIIIHCAAWTNVEEAEEKSDECYKVNVIGTENIAKVAKEINAKLIYISTDYVFDGTKDGLYETSDIPNPQNVYGKTKLRGEEIVKNYLTKYYIIRVSWLFGINGNNFVKVMINQSKTKKEINVVADQYGSPTYTLDLARLLIEIVKSNKYGIYHISNEGTCNWAEFAEYIFKLMKLDIKVNPIPSSEYPQKAYRPKNSCFSKKALVKININLLPTWQNAVERYLIEIMKG